MEMSSETIWGIGTYLSFRHEEYSTDGSKSREHNMIRFKDGAPKSVWYSQHEYGEAFTYEAVPKVDGRPISYSAKGSHANYARVGKHDLHKGSQYYSSPR
jgi:hypothetical protein